MKSEKTIWLGLGYAGLLPFIITTVMSWAGWVTPWLDPKFAFISYSATILSFLAGTLWGRVLSLYASNNIGNLLILSNLYALLAWFSLLLAVPAVGLVTLSFGYFSLLSIEKNCQNLPVDQEYRRMRVRLTSVALLTHFLMLINILFGG
ncbi:DUF3429 domain-containing protein [Shewanella marinintestina]|uniref:DUF3429 domain-containing protein n=1 Tax=Shewanella sairae TaxID=190310 RepID=A0ABQ4PCZ2_9GAMM|nr:MULTISPECIES: DUF3429 domain-containing protein [Shewanella]MCL1131036.1 DUF3429 domain-containing protein [Shewanella sairae]MCL1147777.1 DUF3429 domain-containing protein [Shewanella marinintestina]GIU45361.1 hypothetical protein TUM4438_18650 [Shewanella sairae]